MSLAVSFQDLAMFDALRSLCSLRAARHPCCRTSWIRSSLGHPGKRRRTYHQFWKIWLVVWNMIFSILYGIIIPTEFHIFQRDWNHQPDMFWYVLMFQKMTLGMVLTPSLSLQRALVPMLLPKSVASWHSICQFEFWCACRYQKVAQLYMRFSISKSQESAHDFIFTFCQPLNTWHCRGSRVWDKRSAPAQEGTGPGATGQEIAGSINFLCRIDGVPRPQRPRLGLWDSAERRAADELQWPRPSTPARSQAANRDGPQVGQEQILPAGATSYYMLYPLVI